MDEEKQKKKVNNKKKKGLSWGGGRFRKQMIQYRREAREGRKIQGKQPSSRLNQSNLEPKNEETQGRDLQEKWEFPGIGIID